MRFEILPGLPAYGPPAISFPKSDVPTFREGLVVRFQPEQSEPWVGNFLGGSTDYDRVLAHPNGREAIVVSRGHGCIVDAETKSVTVWLGDLTRLEPLGRAGPGAGLDGLRRRGRPLAEPSHLLGRLPQHQDRRASPVR